MANAGFKTAKHAPTTAQKISRRIVASLGQRSCVFHVNAGSRSADLYSGR